MTEAEIRGPTEAEMAVVFRAEDGREVPFWLLWDALGLLMANSWDGYERAYVYRRLAECLNVGLVKAEPKREPDRIVSDVPAARHWWQSRYRQRPIIVKEADDHPSD